MRLVFLVLRDQLAVPETVELRASLVNLAALVLQANLVPQVPPDLLERRAQPASLVFQDYKVQQRRSLNCFCLPKSRNT